MLSLGNAIAQVNKVKDFGDKLVASAKSGFAEVTTMEQAAAKGDTVAQAAVEEKKAEAKTSLIKTGLLDLLMGALMVVVALRYNRNEPRGGVRILTCVAAFFFWPLYGLYILIRSGALGQSQSMLRFSDLTAVGSQALESVKGLQGDITGSFGSISRTRLNETGGYSY